MTTFIKAGIFCGLFALMLGTLPAEKGDEPDVIFQASGSIYESGDFYLLKVDVYQDRAVVAWEGFAGDFWEFRSADKKAGEGRVKKSFEWTDANVLKSLGVIHANMGACRSIQTAIGQGLSTSVDCSPRPEGMSEALYFFAVDEGDWQASAMQDLWNSSRLMAKGDDKPFLKQLDSLAGRLAEYRRSLDLIVAELSKQEGGASGTELVKLLGVKQAPRPGEKQAKLDSVAREVLAACLTAEGLEKIYGRPVDLEIDALLIDADRVRRIRGAFGEGDKWIADVPAGVTSAIPVASIDRDAADLLMHSLGTSPSMRESLEGWIRLDGDGDIQSPWVKPRSVGEERIKRLNQRGFVQALFGEADVKSRSVLLLQKVVLSIEDDSWSRAKLEFGPWRTGKVLPIEKSAEGKWVAGELWDRRAYYSTGEFSSANDHHFRAVGDKPPAKSKD